MIFTTTTDRILTLVVPSNNREKRLTVNAKERSMPFVPSDNSHLL